jgi:tetratricopeptide (TPR) repeat protein
MSPVTKNPKSWQGWQKRGNHYKIIGQYDEALRCYNEAWKFSPSFGHQTKLWYDYNLDVIFLALAEAECLEKLGRFEEAVKSWAGIWKVVGSQEAFDALSNEINCLLKVGRSEDAIEQIYSFISKHESKELPSGYYEEHKIWNVEQAYTLLFKLIKNKSKITELYYDLGLFLRNMIRTANPVLRSSVANRAIKYFDLAIDNDPNNVIYSRDKAIAIQELKEETQSTEKEKERRVRLESSSDKTTYWDERAKRAKEDGEWLDSS